MADRLEAETARDSTSTASPPAEHAAGVSVEQAEADFAELQRQLTGVSRASRQSRGHKTAADAEKGAAAADADDGSVFDLEAALRGDLAAGQAAGIRPKHIGACWDDLTVRGVGGGAKYVRTFPDALLGFLDVASPLLRLLGRAACPRPTSRRT